MTNSDNGYLISSEVDRMTTGFNVDHYFASDDEKQYPSNTIYLLNRFRKHSLKDMKAEAHKLRESGNLEPFSLINLSNIFQYYDRRMSTEVLKTSVELFPNSAKAYILLGYLHIQFGEYDSAYTYLTRGKELKFAEWEIDRALEKCTRTLTKRGSFSQDEYFGNIQNYKFLDGDMWDIINDQGNAVIGINTTEYFEYFGGPLGEYSLIKDKAYQDFTFSCRARSTEDLFQQ